MHANKIFKLNFDQYMPQVVFKIPAFLSKGLVKKIRNIWLVKELNFRAEIVPSQNVTLISGI